MNTAWIEKIDYGNTPRGWLMEVLSLEEAKQRGEEAIWSKELGAHTARSSLGCYSFCRGVWTGDYGYSDLSVEFR